MPEFSGPFPGFYGFDHPYSDASNNIVFRTRGPNFTSSIYLGNTNNESPSRLLGSGDALPNNVGVVDNVYWPRIENNDVLVTALATDGTSRVYRTDQAGATPQVVLDESTPGLHGARGFEVGDFEDGVFAFHTLPEPFTRQQGVYTSDLDGNVSTIAELGDPLPGGLPGETIAFFDGTGGVSALDGGDIVYFAIGDMGTRGLYREAITGDTAPEIVIDNNTELPGVIAPGGTPIPVTSYRETSISGGLTSFTGLAPNGFPISSFVIANGEIHQLISSGDVIDGKVVDLVTTSPFGLDGDTLAINVHFAVGGNALYLATFTPTPGAAGILGIAGIWTARRRRGRLSA